MKYFKLGKNDIHLLWTISKSDGSPKDITGYKVKLYYTIGGKSIEVEGSIERPTSNTISWTLKKEKQKFPGNYSLLLVLYDNFGVVYDRMSVSNAFSLTTLNSGVACEHIQREGVEQNIQIFSTMVMAENFHGLEDKVDWTTFYRWMDVKQDILTAGAHINLEDSGEISVNDDFPTKEEFNTAIADERERAMEVEQELRADLNEAAKAVSAKQDKLSSGENIKTINGNSILGSGNIEIQGGGTSEYYIFNENDSPGDLLDAQSEGRTIAVYEYGDLYRIDMLASDGTYFTFTTADDGNVVYAVMYQYMAGEWDIWRKEIPTSEYVHNTFQPKGDYATKAFVGNYFQPKLSDTQLANIAAVPGKASQSELTELLVKVGKFSEITPTLSSGVQIATLKKEVEGEVVETPLYAPQGGGGESGKYGVISQTINYNSNGTRTYSNVVRGTIPQSSIDLFVSAGAEFNGSEQPITKTAPWGEDEQHLPGYFYLNGLGDISYQEMMKIYNYGDIYPLLGIPYFQYQWGKDIRTFLFGHDMQFVYNNYGMINRPSGSAFTNTQIDCFGMPTYMGSQKGRFVQIGANMNSMFQNNRRLYALTLSLDNCTSATGCFQNCTFLQHLRLYGLKFSLDLKDCRLVTDASIKHLVDNATNTSAISVTLHADAYANLSQTTKDAATVKNINLVIA